MQIDSNVVHEWINSVCDTRDKMKNYISSVYNTYAQKAWRVSQKFLVFLTLLLFMFVEKITKNNDNRCNTSKTNKSTEENVIPLIFVNIVWKMAKIIIVFSFKFL